MLKVHKKLEYALMILRYLNEQAEGKLSSAKEISEHFQIPFDACSRVLQILSFYSYLKSEQGPKGGYKIGERAMDINLQQLVEMIDGPQAVVKCLEHSGTCPITSTCNVMSPMSILNEKFLEFMRQIPVSDLLEKTYGRTGGELR